jgi:3-isopropylmalate/(R)-2-methylmalate dehydratase large subunit
MFGLGATEMLGVVVTGEIWLEVPETIRFVFDGALARGVTAKDMMLFLIGRFGMGGGQYRAVEYAGEAIRALPMQERMTLANMTAELGGQTGLIAPDEVTREYLLGAGVRDDEIDLATWRSDDGAQFGAEHRFDAAELEPQVAAPGSPANSKPVRDFAGTPINAAYVGACTGAKLVDLRMVAQLLRGRRVAPGVRLWVAPASLRDQEVARGEGTLQALVDAGARLLPNACGACAGYGEFQFGDDDVVISSTARNFRGRMGSPLSQVYLGSPYTVAASAATGRISDPRELL